MANRKLEKMGLEKYPRLFLMEQLPSHTIDHNFIHRKCYTEGLEDGVKLGIRKTCETYCDLICKDAMSCGCMYKYNGRGEVMLNFDYMTCPCNPLTTLRFWTERELE